MAGASGGTKSDRLKPGGAGVDRRLSSSDGVWEVVEAAEDVGRSETEAAFCAFIRRSLRMVISSFASRR